MPMEAPRWPSGGASPSVNDPGHTADLPFIRRSSTAAAPPRDEVRGPTSDMGAGGDPCSAEVAVSGVAASPGLQPEASGPDVDRRLAIRGALNEQGLKHLARRPTESEQTAPVGVARERLRIVRRAVAPRPLTEAEGQVAFFERLLRVPVFGEQIVAHHQLAITDDLTGVQRQPTPFRPEVNGPGGGPMTRGLAGVSQTIQAGVDRVEDRRQRWPQLLSAAGDAWARAHARLLGALHSWAWGGGQYDEGPVAASRGPSVAGARRRPRRPRRRLATPRGTGGRAAGARQEVLS